MANYHTMDPMGSEYDTPNAIGWDFETEGRLISEEIGKRRKKKRSPKDRQKRFKSEMHKHEKRTKKAAQVLAKIDNHPATNATLAAVATVVPFGTAAAGIAKAGLLLTRGVLAIANSKAGKAIHKGIVAVAGLFRKDPARKRRRKQRRKDRKARKQGRNPKAERLAAAQEKAALLGGIKSELKNKDAAKLIKKTIARTIVKADAGDKKAQSEMAGLQTLANPSYFANKLAMAKTANERSQIKIEKSLVEKGWKDGIKLAKRVEKAAKKKAPKLAAKIKHNKPRNNKLQKTIRLVNKDAAKKVAKKVPQKPVQGLLVLAGKSKPKTGKFRKSSGKKKSWLVNPKSGRITSGMWG